VEEFVEDFGLFGFCDVVVGVMDFDYGDFVVVFDVVFDVFVGGGVFDCVVE